MDKSKYIGLGLKYGGNLDGYTTIDGYVLTYSATDNKWEPKPSQGITGSFTAGGDLSGTGSSQQVVSLTGSSNLVNIPSPTALEFGSHSIASQSGLIRVGDVQGSGGSPSLNILSGRNHANSADLSIIKTDGFGSIQFGNDGWGQALLGGASCGISFIQCTGGSIQANGSSNAIISFVLPAFKTQSVTGAFTFDSVDASLTNWLFKVNGTQVANFAIGSFAVGTSTAGITYDGTTLSLGSGGNTTAESVGNKFINVKGLRRNVRNSAIDTAMTTADDIVVITVSGKTATLPASPTLGDSYVVATNLTGSNTYVVNTSGSALNIVNGGTSATSQTFTANVSGQSRMFVYDGTEWVGAPGF